MGCARLLAMAWMIVAASSWPAHAHDGIAGQIARLTAQIKNAPSDGSLLLRRGDLFRVNRQWREALADLDRVEQLDSSLRRVDLVRAHVLFDSSRPAEAVAAADRYLAHDPDHLDALLIRARARIVLRRFTTAADDFTRIIRSRPLPDFYLERARAQRASGAAGLLPALRGLDEGLARIGSIVTVELEALDLERALRQFDRAIVRIDRLAAQSARKEQWLARRGAVLEQAGRRDEARASYAAAIAAAEQLPPRIQRTRATQHLLTALRADLDRLN